MKPQLKVVTNDQNPEPFEIIAESILAIAKGMEALQKSRLQRKVIVTLIHDQSRLGKRDIEMVLNNLQDLARDYLKPKQLN